MIMVFTIENEGEGDKSGKKPHIIGRPQRQCDGSNSIVPEHNDRTLGLTNFK